MCLMEILFVYFNSVAHKSTTAINIPRSQERLKQLQKYNVYFISIEPIKIF